MAVAWLATWTYDSAGRPRLMAATLVDVPPTSTMTPSSMRFDRSAPATEAAGPEYSVRAGARRKPARSVAPPSPRITMTGLLDAGTGDPVADDSAVRIAIGRIDALSAAVTARSSRP